MTSDETGRRWAVPMTREQADEWVRWVWDRLPDRKLWGDATGRGEGSSDEGER